MARYMEALIQVTIAALAAALIVSLVPGSSGSKMTYILGLLTIACLGCLVAIIGMIRVLLRTIDMRVILECGCVAKSDTTLSGYCPVHGTQQIVAYDPVA